LVKRGHDAADDDDTSVGGHFQASAPEQAALLKEERDSAGQIGVGDGGGRSNGGHEYGP